MTNQPFAGTAAQPYTVVQNIQFPIDVAFKKISLTNQASVTDASGRTIFYVKQKMFKLKEAISVFSDESQSKVLFHINANKVIDFSARYNFVDEGGRSVGSVQRHGARSLWKAHYDIFDGDTLEYSIHEESAFTRVMDAMFSEIPVIGMFAGYVFNPVYNVTQGEKPAFKVTKEPAMFESHFKVEKLGDIDADSQQRAILGIMMMMILERIRG